MQTDIPEKESVAYPIWIISRGYAKNLDLSKITQDPIKGAPTEYRISELGQYLLNPNPLTLEEKVIGCKLQYQKPRSGIISRFIKSLFSRTDTNNDNSLSEEIISNSKIAAPAFTDKSLNMHFLKIKELLRPYDPVQKKLSLLDKDKIDNITAVCEDIGKNRHQLNLQGSINDKINFVSNSLSKKVRVAFNRVYLLNGLFEMRGFNFPSFDPNKSYRLIKLSQKKQVRHCVLSAEYRFLYWVEDNSLINYLQLFEQSIKTDIQLRDALTQCAKGDAQPLKLFFSRQREQSYSDKYLPKVYREVLNTCNVGPSEMESIKKILNDSQSIISFNYLPQSGAGKDKLYTTVSVMHDVKALEPIKTSLPEVYSHINKKAFMSDAGRLYLLDSIKGYQNV